MKKTNYIKIKTKKGMMSQMFDDNSKVLPYTTLSLDVLDDVLHFESFSFADPVRIIGFAKGKGFTGVMKINIELPVLLVLRVREELFQGRKWLEEKVEKKLSLIQNF
jgi:hypothetical protein